MSNTRIPRGIALFNAYINTTDNFLQAPIEEGSSTLNWQRLGLTAADATGWHGQQIEWNKLYAKYSNKDTRTKTVNDLVKAFKTNFQDFGGRILDKIAASDGATEQDQNVFNLVLSGNRKKPTHHTTPITDGIVISIVSLGSGMIKADFRTDTDTKRASLAPGADSVQVATKLGDPAPENPYEDTDISIVTRASSKVNMGTKAIGKRLYVFARWYNTRQPDLAGQWSTMFSILIGQ